MMSYGWGRYVPVAERRAKALKKMNQLKKKGQDIQPVTINGNKIAKTFWGKAWCQHLEKFSDYSNRLPRGRTYARNGSVCHLKISKGEIEAIVSGSSLYKINITIKPLAQQKWKTIQQQCSGQIGSMLELLQGKLSDNIMNIVTDSKQGLFPLPSEIELNCNCPDWADLCKHLAAVLYGVGARLDEFPELLFLLRGVDQTQLISQMSVPDTSKSKASNKRQLKGDLGDIFGIDLGEALVKTTKKMVEPTKKPVKPTKKRAVKKIIKSKNFRPTGKTITRLRNQFTMNYSQFARLFGVSNSTISKWEKNPLALNLKEKYKIRLEVIIDLSKEEAWEKLSR
jgi:uncharacterized Zn finger protein